MANLYLLSDTYTSLIDQYNEAESQEEADAILLQLLQVEGVIEDNIDQLHKIWRNEEAEAKKWQPEIDRLKALQARSAKAVDAAKSAILQLMLSANIPKVSTSIGPLRTQNNPPSVQYDGDAKDLPVWMRIVIPISYQMEKSLVKEKWKQLAEYIKSKRPEFEARMEEKLNSNEPKLLWAESFRSIYDTLEAFLPKYREMEEQAWIEETEHQWRAENNFPETVQIIQGKHVR